ncbi:MAG: ATP-dependent protease [Verrucomicrobia bacterium]|nr:ATP-dependent protease [Verrucomicrobiota bacterium]
MPDNDKDKSIKSLEEQFREVLKKANISFMMGGAPQQAAPEQAPPPKKASPDKEDKLRPVREFSLKPRDVRDHLDRFVIRQDEAKKVLSVAICDHYNHVRRCVENPEYRDREHSKNNIILLGPTGVGKTYLVRCIAKLINVPFVKADATKFSETGYVGHDAEDLVRDLVKAADGDVDLAQYGIIYLDEIDKIASAPVSAGKDVSGRGVQINLLKLMEETDVGLFSQTDLISQVQAIMDMQRGKDSPRRTINTRHILFIVSGAFDKLAGQVRQRIRTTQIGFTAQDDRDNVDADYLRQAQTRDFVDYGFEPEFIGRLPIRVVCEPLSAGDLEEIMKSSEGSILSQYKDDFAGYGIDLSVAPEAITAVARRAYEEKTGARGLMTVLERILRDFKFELPSTPVKSFQLSGRTVETPGESLQELLQNKESLANESLRAELLAYVEEFLKEHGMKLVFSKDAEDQILKICAAANLAVRGFCRERFKDLEYGLDLIARNTGRTSFTITRRFIENPREELSARIAKSFEKRDKQPRNGEDK